MPSAEPGSVACADSRVSPVRSSAQGTDGSAILTNSLQIKAPTIGSGAKLRWHEHAMQHVPCLGSRTLLGFGSSGSRERLGRPGPLFGSSAGVIGGAAGAAAPATSAVPVSACKSHDPCHCDRADGNVDVNSTESRLQGGLPASHHALAVSRAMVVQPMLMYDGSVSCK